MYTSYDNPENVRIRKPHPQNLSCYIASANLKFHGDAEAVNFITQSIILNLPQKFYIPAINPKCYLSIAAC
jgi:hypothetical protein